MSSTAKAALLALSLLGGGALVVGLPTVPAHADNVTIGVGPGGIAFGYQDGYWDRDHRWHDWRDREEAERWRAENREHYYDWRHDRDRDQGWRETDHYWDRDNPH